MMAAATAESENPAVGGSDIEEDTSRRSRARVTRACARCRSRKDKCDGQQPQCANCAGAGQPCLYVPASKKRGLPEGYVRGMEKLWAVMTQKIKGLDDTVERVVTEHQEELLSAWNHQKHGDDLHAFWKDSKVLSELEKLLSLLDQIPSNDLKRKRDSGDNGQPTHSANETTNEPYCLSADYRVISVQHFDASGRLNGPPVVNQPLSAHNAAPFPESAATLLNHYFTYTHCWFPILNRPYTLKRFYECRRSHNPVQPATSDLAYLWAICAYCQQQLSIPAMASLPGGQLEPEVHRMRAVARSLIPSELENLEIGHVQALLVLGLLDIGTGKLSSAWMSVGVAVRGVLDAVKSLNSPGKEWLATLQGCFILDTLIAVSMARPPHLRSDQLKNTTFVDEDGHEEWEPWHPTGSDATHSREPAFIMSTFNRMTNLCMIINAVTLQQTSLETTDQALVQVNQVALQVPFPIMMVERRPPHQMLLQALHFAVLTRISQFTHESHAIPRWHFLETIELFEHTWNVAHQRGIPSLIACICHLVSPEINGPAASEEMPPQTKAAAFYQRLGSVLSSLSSIWPGVKGVTSSPSSHQRNVSMQHQSARLRADSQALSQFEPPMPTNFQTPPPQSNMWPAQAAMFEADFPSASIVDPSMPGATATEFTQGMALDNAPNFAASQSFEPIPVDYATMSLDAPEQASRAGFGLSLSHKASSTGGMATSPSFNGDEIDALFHEMAELDTTEWSVDRSQALKDFGFSDDTTFEAFCNDPDRLMLSDAYMGPAYGRKSGAFGSQALLTGNGLAGGLGRSSYGQSYDIDPDNNPWGR